MPFRSTPPVIPLPRIMPADEALGRASRLLRRQTRWVLFLRVFLFAILLGVSTLIQTQRPTLDIPPYPVVFLGITGIFLFSIISAFLLQQLKHFVLFAWLQLAADALITTLVVAATGGSGSIFVLLYFFPVMSGGLLLYLTGGLVMSTSSTLLYGTVLALQWLQVHLPLPGWRVVLPTSQHILIQSLSIYGITFFLVAVLTARLAERLRHTEAALSRTAMEYDRLHLLYKQIFDDITSGIITVDNANTITSFNRAAEEITGYRFAEVAGRDIDPLFPRIREQHDQNRPIITITRKNGETIPVGYSWAKLNLPDGSDDCRVYTLQDLSRIRQMEAQVKQSEKMAAIGEIAAGIAHEFRNPLAAISGAAQVLNQEAGQNDIARSLLIIIIRECARLEDNIVDFLQFSRPARPEKKWIPIDLAVEECVTLLRQKKSFPPALSIERDIPRRLECWADPHQLKQVLLNLLDNAINALRDGLGTVRVEAGEVQNEAGEAIRIAVRDTGIGIEEGMLAHIFEPFVSTRENGTGLGLAIVRQIVDGHGGNVSVESTPGSGTEVAFSLPLP